MAAFDALNLHTARLLLRPLEPADAADLLAVHADAAVMRYSNQPPWTSIDQATALVGQSEAGRTAGRHLCLGLVLREEPGPGDETPARAGTVIGTCTLYGLVRSSRRAEIGFVLGAAWWSRGYMGEALRAVLAQAFEAMDLNRVEADTDPRNAASVRLLERLGFQREGLLRERWLVDGAPSDSAIYGLLQREWRGRP
jgi:[ribosomal protein S5]-alanine N-acetyltransferase